jgi:predicted RNA-binding Zn-ribbon protein involved in translation (DUF1610 family)
MMLLTRDAFERQRAAVKHVERREGRLLATVSVVFGLAQLALVTWARIKLGRGLAGAVAGGILLVYLALVGLLVWRMRRRVRAVRPVCPQCGVQLTAISERVVAATGRCDACGGQIIA